MKSILIVEDDRDIREAVGSALARCGYRTILASHGRDAIDRLAGEATAPDLIVLDWMMPVMSGFEFLNYQATEPAYRDVPVVILSAVDRPPRVSGLSVAATLLKPVRMRTLVEVCDRLCDLPPRPEGAPFLRYAAIGTTPPPIASSDPTPAPVDEVATRPTRMMRRPLNRPR